MGVAVIASGESVRFLPKIIDKFDEAYFVNGNTAPLLVQNYNKLRKKVLHQIANRMLPSIMKPDVYRVLGVKDVFFTVPKSRAREVESSTRLMVQYDMPYYFVPDDFVWVLQNHNNITFYGIALACSQPKVKDVYIIGLDFWTGDYTFKKSTKEQKEIPKRKKLHKSFYNLVGRYSHVNFTMVTVANMEPRSNLRVVKVPKMEES